MSLQERINRLRREWLVSDREVALDEHIAAGLERDYWYTKLADLPEVETSGGESFHWSDAGSAISTKATTESAWAKARGAIALALHLEARESEAAVLARRRDELARELGASPLIHGGYQDTFDSTQRAIDKLIESEDARAAAEAEVARLKGERG